MRAALALIWTALLAQGAGADPVAEGQEIARRWCAECHLVSNSQTEGTDTAPAFATIAGDTTKTDSWLRSWLVDPHPPMPDPGLTQSQVDAVVAYLRTLRP